MSKAERIQIGLVLLFLILGCGAVIWTTYEKYTPTPNNLQQEQINLDSIKDYTTHITDSLTTINVEYKAKIEDKNDIIYTLKGLVNDNNKKYQVITDSALVVELERLRGLGIK